MNVTLTPEQQREIANARRRDYYLKNKEKCLAAQKRYRAKHSSRYTQLQNQWRAKNPLKFYASTIQRTYGLSLEQVRRMFETQNGVCAICLEKFKSKKDIQIDHNHENGKIRSLLCFRCNSGLGHFKDSVSILSNAIEYLNKWNLV